MKAAKAGADIVMLDNFSPKQAKEAVELLEEGWVWQVLLEVSGGINSENLLEYATGRSGHYQYGRVNSQRQSIRHQFGNSEKLKMA